MTSSRPFGLYLHWPFCQSKCPYCDFNSHVATEIDQGRWLRAYMSEIARLGAETSDRVLHTVFFGGGTPSLMDPDIVSAIIEKVRSTWRMTNDPEITMEANPGSVEAGRFAAYRQAGVNRVSVGIQSLDDHALRKLGRTHSAADAMRAFDIARANFPRANFDLIYARQDQSLAAWKSELGLALSMEPTHLSLYQLTVEDGTVFQARHELGQLRGLPDEDLAADMFTLTQDVTSKAGLPAYEVSNHANRGEESRHNLIYWHGDDYAGIGPGAHGRLTSNGLRQATECPKQPGLWLKMVEQQGKAELPRAVLSDADTNTELLMMGLRLYEGVPLDRIGGLAPKLLASQATRDLKDAGMVCISDGRIAVTNAGMILLNAILTRLVSD